MSRPKVVCPLLIENCSLTDEVRKAVQGLGYELAYVHDVLKHLASGEALPEILVLEPSVFHWNWLAVLLHMQKNFPGVPVVLFSAQATVEAGFSRVAEGEAVFLANDIRALRRNLNTIRMMKPGAQKRVLFVDDDESILNSYVRMLRKKPWEVIKSTSGEKALEVLSAEKIDLVVTDIKMPDMHGLTLIARIRGKDTLIPIVVSSGYAGMKDDMEFRYQNIAAFISKPVAEETLHATLGRILEPEE
jgi:DNA-binding NtrC family response regulator